MNEDFKSDQRTREDRRKNVPLTAAIGLGCLAFASCATVKHPPPEKPGCISGASFKNQWAGVKIARDYPIVDVHTHAFNARYLPLKRIIDGRKWSSPFWILPEFILDDAAVLAATSTPKNQAQADDQERRMQAWADAHGKDLGVDSDRLIAILKHPVEPPFFSLWHHEEEVEPIALSPSGWLFHKLVIPPLVRYIITHTFDPAPGQHPAADLEGKAACAVTLLSYESRVRQRLESAFPNVDLFVYQNMDTVPSFYRGKDRTRLIDDGNTQYPGAYHYSHDDKKDKDGPTSALPRIREMCAASHGRMIHFVAWNPFRTLARQRQAKPNLVRSLDIVKNAIWHGASGVKFYPPLGYQPCYDLKKDHLPAKPFFLAHGAARAQWESRYGQMPRGKDVRAALNETNEQLFAWCEAHDIPIFTHCSAGEFRAYHTKEYAENANPKYWIPVLQKHPNLRLCFGHAGGESDWYGECHAPGGDVDDREWGPTVRALCLQYPNVYCEFGCHDHLQDAGEKNTHTGGNPTHAEALYHTLLRELPKKGAGGWPLANKVMYGSDFPMKINLPYPMYLDGFERLFSLPGLEKEDRAKFFGGNAMKYLKRPVADRYQADR